MRLPSRSLWVVAVGAVLLWTAIALGPTDELDRARDADDGAPSAVSVARTPHPSPAGKRPPELAAMPARPTLTPPPADRPPQAAAPNLDADPKLDEGGDGNPHRFPRPERSGPVDEYKALYARESRDAAALEVERDIETAFRTQHIPAGLLESVVCRTSVCRVRTRWSPDHAEGFMVALTALLIVDPEGETAPRFDSILAIDPESDPSERTQEVAVYFRRNE